MLDQHSSEMSKYKYSPDFKKSFHFKKKGKDKDLLQN